MKVLKTENIKNRLFRVIRIILSRYSHEIKPGALGDERSLLARVLLVMNIKKQLNMMLDDLEGVYGPI
jgi:hypothetical protein